MKKYDLIVVGGGITGVAASVCASRLGMKVLLVEKCGSLGGAMTQSLVFPYMKFTADNGKKLLSDGVFTEMRRRKEKYKDSSWETYRFVFDDMIEESGVDVLFHSTVFAIDYENRKIKSISITSASEILTFEADYFIDSTGDGNLFSLANCDYQLGRETDGYCQPMTTCFRLGNVDLVEFRKEIEEIQKLYSLFKKENKIKNPRENILNFTGIGNGIVHLNTTRVVKLNPVNPFDITKAEIMARKQIYEMVDFLKNNTVSFKDSCIISIASEIGVRESRKLKGKYILTAEDLKNTIKFDDAIALGNYDIDIHNPTGTGTYLYHFSDNDFYTIPYRCLVTKEYDNLLVAGRCISATHEAHSSIRIMPICATLGQAAGSAIALAKNTSVNVQEVDVKELQRILVENGASVR